MVRAEHSSTNPYEIFHSRLTHLPNHYFLCPIHSLFHLAHALRRGVQKFLCAWGVSFMKSSKLNRAYMCLALTAAMAIAIMSRQLTAYAEPPGVDIKIRAQNRSIGDTPFCNIGGGNKGDRLDVDAFMDPSGNATGTARFESANGTVTQFSINSIFPFALGGDLGGGLVLQDLGGTGNVVAIWMDSFSAKANLVNVELPRGCGSTVSTFTPGVDKVTVQIKFH